VLYFFKIYQFESQEIINVIIANVIVYLLHIWVNTYVIRPNVAALLLCLYEIDFCTLIAR
jgi:hypothetical protein